MNNYVFYQIIAHYKIYLIKIKLKIINSSKVFVPI